MSLHALANDMAAKGRHGDSMLVHMAPNEVAGLHALALHHGEKLTINPETGLPEAFKLKSLLPLVLGAALGPAGLGLSATMSAGIVGAGYGLAKGSLKEGLLAGLGAYGGAGLAASLGAAGVNEAAAQELAAQQAASPAVEGASAAENFLSTPSAQATATGPTTTMADATGSATPVAEVTIDPVQTTTQLPAQGAPATIDPGSLSTAGYTPPTGLDALSKGAESIYDQGKIGEFAKANKKFLYAAGSSALLSPENEEDMPETKRDPGYIRPARYDWRTGKYQYFDPVKSDEWGTRNLSEYTNANDPGARTPIGAKAGGLMALANGGAVAFEDGGFVTGGGRTSPEEIQRLTEIKAAQDKAAAEKLAAYKPSDPILAPMLEKGVKGMLFGETDEQAYNRIKQMDMERTERRANRDALRAQMGPDDVAIDGVISRTTSGDGGGGTTPQPGGPTNPQPPVPTTPSIASSTTGGSRKAYEYLSGEGDYPVNPYLPTGTPIAKPYWESVGMTDPYKGPKVIDELKNPNTTPKTAPPAGQKWVWNPTDRKWVTEAIVTAPPPTTNDGGTGGAKNGGIMRMAQGGTPGYALGGLGSLGGYSDGGRLLRGPGDGVSDSIPATIGGKRPARLADGEFVVPARIVSELGNGSTEAGSRKLYAMMDRVQRARGGTTGKGKVAKNSRADKYLPA